MVVFPREYGCGPPKNATFSWKWLFLLGTLFSKKYTHVIKEMVVFFEEHGCLLQRNATMFLRIWLYSFLKCSYVLEDMVVFPKEMQPCSQRYGYVPLKSATMFLRTWLCSTRKNFIQNKCIELSPMEMLVFPNEHGCVPWYVHYLGSNSTHLFKGKTFLEGR
jgi:hypothetical protein